MAHNEQKAGDEEPQRGPWEWSVASPLLLRVWGLLPWDGVCDHEDVDPVALLYRLWRPSALYQHTLLVLAIGVAAEAMVNCGAAMNTSTDLPGQSVHFYVHLADAILAVGGVAGLLASWSLAPARILGTRGSVLLGYARQEGLALAWHRASQWQGALLVLAWTLMALCHQQAQVRGAGGLEPRDYLHLAAFAFRSGLAVALLHAFLHPVTSLVLMLDYYCYKLVQSNDSSEQAWKGHVAGWNILQAMIRRVAGLCQWGILILQTTTLCALLVVGIVLVQDSGANGAVAFWSSLAFLPLAAAAAWLLHRAAEVTERCADMPAFVNCVHSRDDAINQNRHFLVEYVAYSRAGFYVKEVPITGAMVLKCYCIGFLMVLMLLNRFITQ